MIRPRSQMPAAMDEPPPYEMSFPVVDEEESGGGFTLLQLWLMVRAYLWLSIPIFVVAVIVAFVAIRSMPKSYNAVTTLIVNSDNTDPLAGRNFVGNGSFFSTQVELINNNTMLLPVIERLKMRTDPRFIKDFTGDAKALDDMLLERLRSVVRVQPGNGSQLLYISASAPEPGLAAELANGVADEYVRQSSRRMNAPAIERAERYTSQLGELKEKVAAAQAKVVEFRQRYGVGMADLRDSPGGELESSALVDLQNQLATAQNARRQLESRRVDPNADSTEVLEAPETLVMRDKLGELQGQMGQARATLGAKHPRILQLQSEIDAMQRALDAAVRARHDSATLTLTRARELETRYAAAVTQERQRLLGRGSVQEEGSKLLLEQRLAEEAYAQALRGLQTVEFASQGNYQDIAMVSRAEPPRKPAGSNKRKMFAMALFAGLAAALGGPFLYELLIDRRIRSRDDLEKSLRIVTLAVLGPMKPASGAA